MEPVYFDVLADPLDAAVRADVLRIWRATTEAGAAVGLRPGATDGQYEDVLAAHEAAMAEGRAWLHLIRSDPSGELLGFAWWIIGQTHDAPHIATIKRLQLRPDRHGCGLGRAFMDYLHSDAVLALMGDGVDFLHLQFRAGDGLGGFYASYGYELNVRWDMVRKRDDGTYGGWMEMIRRRDGLALPELGW